MTPATVVVMRGSHDKAHDDKVLGFGGRLHRWFILRRLRKRWLAPR